MMAGRTRETPLWQQGLAKALGESLPRLLDEPASPELQELITALTVALCRGEVLLDLSGEAPAEVSASLWPAAHRRALADSALTREPDGPLVLRGDQLAWRRWVERQQHVLEALLDRAGCNIAEGGLSPAPPPGTIANDALCPADSAEAGSPALEPELQGLDLQQRRAVLAGLSQRLLLILGGPGTGKTSTVAQLLAALRRRQPEARVHLAAPTGKAAARLRTACGGRETCSTLHRLLESRGDGFGRHRRRPLELDLLVIDEVSMVDLELMEAVLEALPPSCRLVLVGDPAQLPPIAPGPVLQLLQEPPLAKPLAAVRIELRTTYRNDGAIARVADALRAAMQPAATAGPGAAADGLAALAAARPLLERLSDADNLSWHQASRDRLPDTVLQRLRAHQRRLADLAVGCWPNREHGWAELLQERERLLVLSPLRGGRWGIDAIHCALLGRAAVVTASGGEWPVGTPLLCRRNLPDLGLANGDIGVVVSARQGDANDGGDQRLLFGQDAPLWLHPAQLAGALEPALALTVHKAQGSEARELIVLLEDPAQADPRLLYTALTRARQRALLITAEDIPAAARLAGSP